MWKVEGLWLHMKHQETWSWPQVGGALNVTSLQLSRRLGILVLLKLCVHKQNLMKMVAERATLQSSIQSSDQSIQGVLSNLCYCLYYNSTTALPTQRVNLWKKRASDTYGIVRIKWPRDDYRVALLAHLNNWEFLKVTALQVSSTAAINIDKITSYKGEACRSWWRSEMRARSRFLTTSHCDSKRGALVPASTT